MNVNDELLAMYNRELQSYHEHYTKAVQAAEVAEQASEMLTALEAALKVKGIERQHKELKPLDLPSVPPPVEEYKGKQPKPKGRQGKRGKYRKYWWDVAQWIASHEGSLNLEDIAAYIFLNYDDDPTHKAIDKALQSQIERGEGLERLVMDAGEVWYWYQTEDE